MSSKPEWLDDDMSDEKSDGDASPDIRVEAHQTVIPTPPRAPATRNEGAYMRSPISASIPTSPNVTTIDDDLEANGLGFLKSDGNNYLRKVQQRAKDNEDSLSNASFGSCQLEKDPLKATKSTKNGLLLEDMSSGMPSTNAPVHFIKRMQDAERKRKERIAGAPAPPSVATPSKKERPNITKKGAGKKNLPLQRSSSSSSSSSISSSSPSASLSFSSDVPEEDRVEARLAKSKAKNDRKAAKKSAQKKKNKGGKGTSSGGGSAPSSLGGTLTSNASMARTLNEAMGLEPIDSTAMTEEDSPPGELDEETKKEHSTIVDVFGDELCKYLLSKRYSHRCTGIAMAERAVVAAQHREEDKHQMLPPTGGGGGDTPVDEFDDILSRATGGEEVSRPVSQPPSTPPTPATAGGTPVPNDSYMVEVNSVTLGAFFYIIDKAVSDVVIPVCRAGCAALSGVIECIGEIPLESRCWEEPSATNIAGVSASLVRRLRDGNNKVREAVSATLLCICKHRDVSGTQLITTITGDQSTDAGHLVAKMDVAQSVLETSSVNREEVADALLSLVVNALSSTAVKTRKRGVSFFAYLNMVLGDAAAHVDTYLAKVKPSTVKMLKQELNMAEEDVFGPSKSLKGSAKANSASTTLMRTQARRDEIEDIAQLECEETSGTLSSAQKKRIAELVEKLGSDVPSIGCVESTQWKLRERALKRVTDFVVGNALDPSQCECIVEVVAACLLDSVPAVSALALSLTNKCISHMTENLASRSDLKIFLRLCGPIARLTTLSSEAASSVTEETVRTIEEGDEATTVLLSLAKIHGSHAVSKALVTQPLQVGGSVEGMFTKGPVKVVSGRLDIISAIINVTVSDKNLDLEMLMEAATSAFKHAQSKVRSSAAALITALYRRVGEQIRPFLTSVAGASAEELRKRMSSLSRRDKAKAGVGRKLAIFRGGAYEEDAEAPSLVSPRPPHAPSSQQPHTSLRSRIAAASKPPPSPPRTTLRGQETGSTAGLTTPRLNAAPVLLSGSGPHQSNSSRKGNLVFS